LLSTVHRLEHEKLTLQQEVADLMGALDRITSESAALPAERQELTVKNAEIAALTQEIVDLRSVLSGTNNTTTELEGVVAQRSAQLAAVRVQLATQKEETAKWKAVADQRQRGNDQLQARLREAQERGAERETRFRKSVESGKGWVSTVQAENKQLRAEKSAVQDAFRRAEQQALEDMLSLQRAIAKSDGDVDQLLRMVQLAVGRWRAPGV